MNNEKIDLEKKATEYVQGLRQGDRPWEARVDYTKPRPLTSETPAAGKSAESKVSQELLTKASRYKLMKGDRRTTVEVAEDMQAHPEKYQ